MRYAVRSIKSFSGTVYHLRSQYRSPVWTSDIQHALIMDLEEATRLAYRFNGEAVRVLILAEPS